MNITETRSTLQQKSLHTIRFWLHLGFAFSYCVLVMAKSEKEKGAEFRRWRERAGVSLTELAAAVGLSTSKLSRYECGLGSLQTDEVRRLFEALYERFSTEQRYLLSEDSGGASLATLRQACGWSTQRELAELIGCSVSKLVAIEKGRSPLTSDLVAKINQLASPRLKKLAPVRDQVAKGLSPEAIRRIRENTKDSRPPAPTSFDRLAALAGLDSVSALGGPSYGALQAENETLKARLATADNLINKMGEFIIRFHEVAEISLQELREKNATIAELEDRVKELRDVWDAGVEMTLAHEKFERLRGKVTGNPSEKEE